MKILVGLVFLAATLLFSSVPEVSFAKGAAARGVDVSYGSTSRSGCVNGICPVKGKKAGARANAGYNERHRLFTRQRYP